MTPVSPGQWEWDRDRSETRAYFRHLIATHQYRNVAERRELEREAGIDSDRDTLALMRAKVSAPFEERAK